MSEERPLIAGHYELGEMIGRGGMGDVYRGLDTTTSQPVAVKLLHQNIIEDNPDIVDRFRREGEALSQLNHPNIVKLLDALEENGKHYLVMEYVSGGSLRDLLDHQGRLPLEGVLNLALDLADALTRAHRLKIIHRDIKPDNVLLAEDGTPRLTDFGVAHLADRTRLTQTGSVIGTYAYLSPEACNGEDLDERTDIWSFGVMLFEMLAGRLPFQENSTGAILTAILTKPAPDLSRLRPGTPDALVNLIHRMLEKDRTRRISSVRLIGAELEAIMLGLDTPLRSLLIGVGGQHEGSRFATPSEGGSGDVPAMIRSPGGQTHGLSIYPPAPPTSYTAMPAGPMFTPGGTPITGEYVPKGTNFKWVILLLMALVLAGAAVIIAAILAGLIGGEEAEGPPKPASMVVEPVAPDEYMVLVASLERLGNAPERNISRTIADDLRQQLDINVPFSKVRVREYPGVITSDEAARAAAEANDATVILWGSYSVDTTLVEVQVGGTTAFRHMTIPLDRIERSANVRVRLDNQRATSVASQVMGVLAVLQAADGSVYEYMRALAVAAKVDEPAAETTGDSIAAHVHHYFSLLPTDLDGAIEHISHAIDNDPTNPLLYVLRGASWLRKLDVEAATRDAETAARLAPPEWPAPLYLLANIGTPDQQIPYDTRIIATRPDDWYPLADRGENYYFLGDLDNARTDLEAAIALKPNTNHPYALAAMVAISQGRFEDAIQYIQVIAAEFPDPDLHARVTRATVGNYDPVGPLVAAFVNIVLGRYDAAITAAQTARERGAPPPDALTMEGLSYCNLGNDQAAQTAFDQVIDQYSGGVNPFVQLLRGDVRRRLGDAAGAQADFEAAATYMGAENPLVQGFMAGQMDCTNYFGTAVVMGGAPSSAATPSVAAPPATPEPAAPVSTAPPLRGGPAAEPIPVVEPVAPNELMVLVAPVEDLSGTGAMSGRRPRDLTRFIVDNLQQSLVEEIPNSPLRIREYPAVLSSDEAARAAAEANGATVIVWGNYTDELIELEVQIGVVSRFRYIHFSREALEKLANVRVHLTDERRQTVAQQVVNIVNMLTTADGDEIGFFLSMAVLDGIDVTGGEVVGNGFAANMHRGLANFTGNPTQAIRDFNAAIALDSGSPFGYMYRALAYLRLGNAEQVKTDLETALRLGPENWTGPAYLGAGFLTTDQDLLARYDAIIALRPEDWYPYYQRAIIHYYRTHDLALANEDLTRSIALQPITQFPYLLSLLIALREGRIGDAQDFAAIVIRNFPDPEVSERAMQALLGANPDDLDGLLASVGTNLLLGQYPDVVRRIGVVIRPIFSGSQAPAPPEPETAQYWDLADLLLIQGIAYCNLGNYPFADTALSRAILVDPHYPLLHVLRAQVRARMNPPGDTTEDKAALADHGLGAGFDAWVQAADSGAWTCENFFDYRVPSEAGTP